MDISALKSRLNQLQNTTSTKDNLWKPEPGKTQVRVVPYKHNKDNPFMEMFFHYGLGNKIYLSPSAFSVTAYLNKIVSGLYGLISSLVNVTGCGMTKRIS